MIDINCDMGEGLGNEAELMPYIHSANIACGYHAGDEETIRHVMALCISHRVNIGAHPSFHDRENFGRTQVSLTENEIYRLITDQLMIIGRIADEQGAKLHHVKPHGALYNMAAKDAGISRAIAGAVKDFDDQLVFYGLSGSVMLSEARSLGLRTAHEVFADRTYQSDGSLTPRTEPNALLESTDAMLEQVKMIVNEKKVRTLNGEVISLLADTICLHGDGEKAIPFAKAIHQLLHEK